jgi:hypothetical protein
MAIFQNINRYHTKHLRTTTQGSAETPAHTTRVATLSFRSFTIARHCLTRALETCYLHVLKP